MNKGTKKFKSTENMIEGSRQELDQEYRTHPEDKPKKEE